MVLTDSNPFRIFLYERAKSVPEDGPDSMIATLIGGALPLRSSNCVLDSLRFEERSLLHIQSSISAENGAILVEATKDAAIHV